MATTSNIKEFIRDIRVEMDARNAEKFVAKVVGKQLSTEDYTNADKTKLAGISAGAQVNVIESVKLNGTAITVDDGKAVNIDLSDYALKSDVTGAIAGAYHTKGSVNSFADLPASGNKAGDVYNILTAGGTDRNGTAITAGVNVVYVEDETNPGFDALGGVADLSNYVEKETGKGLSTNDFTDADKLLLGSLSAAMDEDFTEDDVAYVFTDPETQDGGGRPIDTAPSPEVKTNPAENGGE